MIKLELLSEKNFNKYSLDNYERKQEVKRVYRKSGNEYVLVDMPYAEDWSLEKKRRKKQVQKRYIYLHAPRKKQLLFTRRWAQR